MSVLSWGIEAVERGLVPDVLTRSAIRRLCRSRLRDSSAYHNGGHPESRAATIDCLHCGPIARVPEKANQQHYELPAEFFAIILGPRRKYSCCWFADECATLAEAEDSALAQTCQRADLVDGQDVLELGCGWGSLSLWMAQHYPNSRITAVSNSLRQRQFIEAKAADHGFQNLRTITADMNEFAPPAAAAFDRVVSVEMFEHMHNYRRLLERIAGWLRRDGKLFVHLFCHRKLTYAFDVAGEADWMGRHFFTGGLMPSADLLSQFPEDLQVREQYAWNGRHYQRTALAWLSNLDARHDDVLRILGTVYGTAEARRWLNRWRVFLLAVGELFGYGQGEEWFVSHYVMQHPD